MNFANDFITYNKIFFDSKCEASAESEVLLPDYHPPIMKLVRTEAVPFVRSQTTYGEKVVVEGNTEFRVVYISEDGSICSFFTKVPFSCTAEVKALEESYPIFISPSVDYYDVRALSPQKMHVKATVCVYVKIMCPEMLPVLSANDEPGVAELKTMNASYCKNVCCGRKSMKLSDEIDLGTRSPADELLNYYVSFTETENKLLINKIVVKGDMNLKLVYFCKEKKEIEVYEQRIPISQIIDIDNIDEDTICNIGFSLADCNIECRENDEGEKKIVVYDMEVAVTVTGYQVFEAMLVEDAFGVKKEIECIRKPFYAEKALVQNETVAFNEVVDIGSNSKINDLNVCPRLGKIYYDKENRCATVTGQFNVSVIMEDSDGEISCVIKNIPFTMKTELENICFSVRGELEMSVTSSAFVPVDSTKIEFRINCLVKGCLFITEEAEVLAEINILEDKECKSDCNVILYFAQKGESIWEIAKKYSTSPKCLMANNGICDEILTSPKTLMISIK